MENIHWPQFTVPYCKGREDHQKYVQVFEVYLLPTYKTLLVLGQVCV